MVSTGLPPSASEANHLLAGEITRSWSLNPLLSILWYSHWYFLMRILLWSRMPHWEFMKSMRNLHLATWVRSLAHWCMSPLDCASWSSWVEVWKCFQSVQKLGVKVEEQTYHALWEAAMKVCMLHFNALICWTYSQILKFHLHLFKNKWKCMCTYES
jgi:hypothetical protein